VTALVSANSRLF